jgi:hypothetical protein
MQKTQRTSEMNHIGTLKDQNSPEMCWSRGGGGMLIRLCMPSLL